MENNNYQIWTVKLASNHDGYQEVGFRKPDCYTNHTVIEVDMTKFIHYCDKNSGIKMVPTVNLWEKNKVEGIKEFLSPPKKSEYYPEMPIVAFIIIHKMTIERKFLFFKKEVMTVEKFVGFTNGRHRTRYLQFAGAKKMWVLCPNIYCNDLIEYCGADNSQ